MVCWTVCAIPHCAVLGWAVFLLCCAVLSLTDCQYVTRQLHPAITAHRQQIESLFKGTHWQQATCKAKIRLDTAGVGSVWRKIEHQRERLLNAAPDSIEQDIQRATQAPSTMRRLRSQLKKTAGKLQETAPQLTIAGGGLFMTLNNWGLVPESDVLPLEQFNRVWQPDEPERSGPYPSAVLCFAVAWAPAVVMKLDFDHLKPVLLCSLSRCSSLTGAH